WVFVFFSPPPTPSIFQPGSSSRGQARNIAKYYPTRQLGTAQVHNCNLFHDPKGFRGVMTMLLCRITHCGLKIAPTSMKIWESGDGRFKKSSAAQCYPVKNSRAQAPVTTLTTATCLIQSYSFDVSNKRQHLYKEHIDKWRRQASGLEKASASNILMYLEDLRLEEGKPLFAEAGFAVPASLANLWAGRKLGKSKREYLYFLVFLEELSGGMWGVLRAFSSLEILMINLAWLPKDYHVTGAVQETSGHCPAGLIIYLLFPKDCMCLDWKGGEGGATGFTAFHRALLTRPIPPAENI
ncbi:hypothetical protein Nmel_009494, partial [Mimus melanotis]